MLCHLWEVNILSTFKIFYRIGMAGEKIVLSDIALEDAYYGICFGANVACFGRTWVSQFINLLGKPFFIDPMTYAFQFDLKRISKECELKKSFSKLVDTYGRPFDSVVTTKHQLTLTDFNDSNIDSLVKNVLGFQKNIAKTESNSQKSLMEFGEWLDEKPAEQEPEFLVAPYFWFDTPESDWYKLNLQIMDFGKKYSKNIPVYGMICTDIETILNDQWVSKIISDFNGMDGIILWLSDFYEYKIDKKTLISYLKFIQKLSSNKNIIMMYGSYFSIIASKFGLNGISPGIGISESKKVKDQTTGGTFSNKYYVLQSKSMIVDADARSFYADNPDSLCKCDICGDNEIHDNNDVHKFFDELTPLKAKRHYCMCRNLETEEIEKKDEKGILSILSSNLTFCDKKIGDLYNIPYHHQARWLSAIHEFNTRKKHTNDK